ncbi:hypothetical protein NA56DRAFT_653750 [Hyaloscypha hepaticicola]|uniref:Uncharacterized protein n=1 Tax=Hyaloscypha hepaticicola TaxID=2082293 RepID=A0A2J6QNX5_9HELO|nr:hypothetical protein NA56DRAFT_653750 [Hyaloscypha hepaticicola]
MSANPDWREKGARDKACSRARRLLRWAAGYGQTTGAQRDQMEAVMTGTIYPLYVGYTQHQRAVPFAPVRGAVAAAAAGGLLIPAHRLPKGAANFLVQQGILGGWAHVAQPLPAAAMPPPPPGFVPPAAQAAQAPALPAPAPAAPGAAAPAPAPAPAQAADDDDDDDDEDEEDQVEEEEKEEDDEDEDEEEE